MPTRTDLVSAIGLAVMLTACAEAAPTISVDSELAAPEVVPVTAPLSQDDEVPVTRPQPEPVAGVELIPCLTEPGRPSDAASGSGRPAVRLKKLADFDLPQALASLPGDCLLYVGEQEGLVLAFDPAQSPNAGGPGPVPVLDLRDQVSAGVESGLVGLEFSPDGQFLYTSYTIGDFENSGGGDRLVVEFRMDGQQPDPASARLVISIPQVDPCHNAGAIRFGPDAYLYVSVGDDDCTGFRISTGQDVSDLKGSILRIDPRRVVGDRPYAVPEDNPFSSGGGARELWMFGLRNPYQFSFDMITGDLWVADVGTTIQEEITLLAASEGGGRGANLGFPVFEGAVQIADAIPPDLVAPLHSYDHRDRTPGVAGCSIIGGFVYRGAVIAELTGWYVYTDFCDSNVKVVRPTEDGADAWHLDATVVTPTALGQDSFGEIYFASWENKVGARAGGAVYALVPAE